MILLRCRRCSSGRLFVLSKVWATDNDVYRCRECGFLFSPTSPARRRRMGNGPGSREVLRDPENQRGMAGIAPAPRRKRAQR